MMRLSNIPAISSVRNQAKLDVTFAVNVRYTDNAAPEGNDERCTLWVTRQIVGTGPDCDGTRGSEDVLAIQFEGFEQTEYCSTYATNEDWKGVVYFLYGRICGEAAGFTRGKRQEGQNWLEVVKVVTEQNKATVDDLKAQLAAKCAELNAAYTAAGKCDRCGSDDDSVGSFCYDCRM